MSRNRTWTATDACGNSTSVTQNIIYGDVTPPVLSGVPLDAEYTCIADVPPPPVVTAQGVSLPVRPRWFPAAAAPLPPGADPDGVGDQARHPTCAWWARPDAPLRISKVLKNLRKTYGF